jgi:hypothetical protein
MSSDPLPPRANRRTAVGIVEIVAALAIYLWARGHSPHMGFGEMLTKFDSYLIKEPVYSGILLIAAVIALLGVVSVVRGLQGGVSRAWLRSQTISVLPFLCSG